MSMYEKYLAVYNIVKQYKKYQHSPKDRPMESRNIKFILDNEYIVINNYEPAVGESGPSDGKITVKNFAALKQALLNMAYTTYHLPLFLICFYFLFFSRSIVSKNSCF